MPEYIYLDNISIYSRLLDAQPGENPEKSKKCFSSCRESNDFCLSEQQNQDGYDAAEVPVSKFVSKYLDILEKGK
jgi:hypothetical protein